MPVRLQTLVQASFTGMMDALEPETGTARKAKLLQNVYPLDAEKGGGCTGRPGFMISSSGAALGVTGHRIVQRFVQFTKLDGTEYTVGFCGGKMYTYSWASAAWTNVSLAASVGLTSDLLIYCTTYNNTLVVQPNDGTNKPWTWDGSTFASLTNAPLAFGPVTVYYAKLFFIVWGTRNQIQWSEENAANTGYNSGGYVNYWNLTQTDNSALTALYGTNEALYYWRARSMGRVMGAVTPTFSSDGTHDAVSLTTGTTSPATITNYETDIFFLDADGRPFVLSAGGIVNPFWTDYRQTLLNIPRTSLTTAVAATFTPVPIVLLAVQETGQSQNNLLLTVKPAPTAAFSGLWRGWLVNAMGLVKNASGVPTLMIGGNDGYAYIVGDPNTGTTWDDEFQGGTVAVQHVVQGGYLGFDPKLNRQYDRLRALLKSFTTMSNVVLDYQSPATTETLDAQTASAIALALWDVADWDSATWSTPGTEVPLEWGTQGYGRWLLPRLTHQAVGERFGLNAFEVDAYDSGVDAVSI